MKIIKTEKMNGMRFGVIAKMIGVALAVMLTGLVGSASIGHATTIENFFTFLGPTGDDGKPSVVVNSELTLTAKSKIPDGDTSLSLIGGDPGRVFVGGLGFLGTSVESDGVGVRNFDNSKKKVGGSMGISGAGGHQDESLIFNFTTLAWADSIILKLVGLNGLDTGDDVISLQLEFSETDTPVIASDTLAQAIVFSTITGVGTLDFSALGVDNSPINSFALRVTEGHFGVAGITYTTAAPVPQPEPSTLLLLGSGLAGLGLLRRKRKKGCREQVAASSWQ